VEKGLTFVPRCCCSFINWHSMFAISRGLASRCLAKKMGEIVRHHPCTTNAKLGPHPPLILLKPRSVLCSISVSGASVSLYVWENNDSFLVGYTNSVVS
jgi:hypothetical protein